MGLMGLFWKQKKVENEWISILFEDCPGIENIFETDEYLLALDAAEAFVRTTCDPRDWASIRIQQGYTMVTIGYKFRNEVDATAFKLRWG